MKTLCKENKHFNDSILIKKNYSRGKNKMRLLFFMLTEKKM